MRMTWLYRGTAFSLLACLAVGGAGCVFSGTYCEEYGCDGAGGAGSTSSTTTTSSTGVAMDCIPTETAGPKDSTCGIFVDPQNGADSNPGTLTSPKKTLGSAATAWTSGKAIYACAGALTDTQAVSLPAGVVLYGGLDCAAGYKAGTASARTTLAPAAGVIPLTLAGGAAPTEVHALTVTASAASTAGSSAVGVVIDDVKATLDRVDVTAGDGVNGLAATTPTDNVGSQNPNDPSVKGTDGNPANTTTPATKNPGGPGVVNPLCTSTGGSGGDGGEVLGMVAQSGVTGSDGQVLPVPNPNSFGLGGPGEGAIVCMPGHDGSPGGAVTDGDGAHGPTSIGTLALDGYHGTPGTAGPDGKPGQGGGGGGGAKGKGSPATRGASGGSGGAGGCGGKGAPGGGAGGSSIALVVLGTSAPTLTSVTLHVGKGGDGGAGALGESAGVGGNGGGGGLGTGAPTTPAACNGGRGGAGSNGASSGGGRGGHSLGIAFVTAAPTSGYTVQKGAPGQAGATAGAGAQAEPGVAADTQALPAQ